MKKNKKFLSAVTVFAVGSVMAAAIPFAGCSEFAPSADGDEDITHVISVAYNNGVAKSVTGEVYWVSPDGKAENDGKSLDSPKDIVSLLMDREILKPGDTVYFVPGVYKNETKIDIAVSGEYNKYIKFINATMDSGSGYVLGAGESGEVTLDFSAQTFQSDHRGVQMYGSYLYWCGIDVAGAGDNGLYIAGSYNTIENSEFYNNRDTGLQLGRAYSAYTSIDQWPSYNLVKNCTSHNNYDNETYGENADGFAAKLTVGYGNVFDGCIAYRNSDDGWDLYAKADSGNIGTIIMYNCVAFENGFLEYTQRECNAFYASAKAYRYIDPNDLSKGQEWVDVNSWRSAYSEDPTNPLGSDSYYTRDGDGNGFKLGGSVMEGDVVMYNCLSFNNKMHGVTDNSNPGFLKVEKTTSYDNSAVVSNENYGRVEAIQPFKLAEDGHGNINVARQEYSYNSLIDNLSVSSGMSLTLAPDEYRGSVTDSYLLGNNRKANIIEGSIDADTRNPGGTVKTSEGNQLVAADLFEKIPVVLTVSDDEEKTKSYEYVLDGARNLYGEFEYHETLKDITNSDGLVVGKDIDKCTFDYTLNADRFHKSLRNADGSINMHGMLEVKDYSLLFGDENKIGSFLSADGWDGYTHFYEKGDFVDPSQPNQMQANVERVKEALTINCDENAVYQDFDVPTKMVAHQLISGENDVDVKVATIKWTTSDAETLVIDADDPDNIQNSLSTSQYLTVRVYRGDADKKVMLTATITCDGATATKVFELTVKGGTPELGTMYVKTQDGERVDDGVSVIIDQFTVYSEPELCVENGLDYNGKLLKEGTFTTETKYEYATDANSAFSEVKGFMPSTAGVYRITTTAKLGANSKSMSYMVFVASSTANVGFIGDVSITVNQHGYVIGGSVSSATGYLYAVSSKTEQDVTADNMRTLDGFAASYFRATDISIQFENANDSTYHVYYALANASGRITSEITHVQINVIDVTTKEDFVKIAGGATLQGETANQTIYTLTSDLDFAGANYSVGDKPFRGVLNGLGHTVSNITISKAGNAAVIYKLSGGTVENIRFNNISINTTDKCAGIIAQMEGGYIYNVAVTNIAISGSNERIGGMVGQVFESASGSYISNVSVVNDDDHKIEVGSKRLGGIVGLAQTTSSPKVDFVLEISNCYVRSCISGVEQVGGILGSFDNQKSNIDYRLKISQCVTAGEVRSTHTTPRLGGILGYEPSNIGSFEIRNCVSMMDLYNGATGSQVLVSPAQKTASGIVGGYSSTSMSTVVNCMALIEEYNSNYDVTAFSLTGNVYATTFSTRLDTENLWKLEIKEGEGLLATLKAPYITLNFLGDWA